MSEEPKEPEPSAENSGSVWKDLVVTSRHMKRFSELARRRNKAWKKGLAAYIEELERQGLEVSSSLRERLREEQARKNLPS